MEPISPGAILRLHARPRHRLTFHRAAPRPVSSPRITGGQPSDSTSEEVVESGHEVYDLVVRPCPEPCEFDRTR